MIVPNRAGHMPDYQDTFVSVRKPKYEKQSVSGYIKVAGAVVGVVLYNVLMGIRDAL
jgi:hypothetical protein